MGGEHDSSMVDDAAVQPSVPRTQYDDGVDGYTVILDSVDDPRRFRNPLTMQRHLHKALGTDEKAEASALPDVVNVSNLRRGGFGIRMATEKGAQLRLKADLSSFGENAVCHLPTGGQASSTVVVQHIPSELTNLDVRQAF